MTPTAPNVYAIPEDLAQIDFVVPPLQSPLLGSYELQKIHQDIKATSRPAWKTSPPANFGTPAHGKLKADEWRACIEFDLPVSLLRLWAGESGEAANGDRLAVIRSTILLSIAIRYATSHAISPMHINEYFRFMHSYIASIRDLRPSVDLHPIHHNALHLDRFLRLFGPIHGWWMFPIERLIGMLQKLNINYKPGMLDPISTWQGRQLMLKFYCRTARKNHG
jgi:hypothetical protein